ncbi:hypothetical protein HAX54_002238 [Datura stramonium]|uniref:Uncharacterized protein n=1 Tax=Datura stramonium TaxID=4076 RepID=A0ABS8T3K2_DATST|nr:hypothetical protein [Datura stramonium]
MKREIGWLARFVRSTLERWKWTNAVSLLRLLVGERGRFGVARERRRKGCGGSCEKRTTEVRWREAGPKEVGRKRRKRSGEERGEGAVALGCCLAGDGRRWEERVERREEWAAARERGENEKCFRVLGCHETMSLDYDAFG